MKRILAVLLIMVCNHSFGQNTGYKIEGKTNKKNNNKRIALTYQQGRMPNYDTVEVKGGRFSFSGAISSPVKATLTLINSGLPDPKKQLPDQITVYLSEGTIKINFKDSLVGARMKGTTLNDEYQRYIAHLSPAEEKIKDAERKWLNLEDGKKEGFSYERMFIRRNAGAEKRDLMLEYARQNPSSLFSLNALSELSIQNVDVPVIKPIFDNLSEELKISETGQRLKAKIEKESKILVGAMAPDFEQNDINGNLVKLSDYRGQYVLLDFWASWCGPCRAENPNLIDAYDKFKDRNFTILGVSLDNPGQKEAWLKAIEKDGLKWTQVSDLQGWDNKVAKLYSITGVPQSFIIDPKGVIIARRLSGQYLHEFLEKTLPIQSPKM